MPILRRMSVDTTLRPRDGFGLLLVAVGLLVALIVGLVEMGTMDVVMGARGNVERGMR